MVLCPGRCALAELRPARVRGSSGPRRSSARAHLVPWDPNCHAARWLFPFRFLLFSSIVRWSPGWLFPFRFLLFPSVVQWSPGWLFPFRFLLFSSIVRWSPRWLFPFRFKCCSWSPGWFFPFRFLLFSSTVRWSPGMWDVGSHIPLARPMFSGELSPTRSSDLLGGTAADPLVRSPRGDCRRGQGGACYPG